MIAVQNFAVENLQRQRILNQLLDRALQRTRAKVRIVTLREQQIFGRIGQLQRNLAIGEQAANVFEAQLDDPYQLFLAQRTEDDDVVDAVQELRLEVRVQQLLYLLAGFLEIPPACECSRPANNWNRCSRS